MPDQGVVVQEPEIGGTEFGAQAGLATARIQKGGRSGAAALDPQIGGLAVYRVRLQ